MTSNSSNNPQTPPVIIAGMHRSGTSMLARRLQQAGLFIGADLDPNAESGLFMRWNCWALMQAGCRWDQPESWCLPPMLADRAQDQLHLIMQDARSCQPFYGKQRRLPPLIQYTQPWGWKDPRNTLTANLWLAVFPTARVLVITRHGLDVAASLQRRASDALQQWIPKTGTSYHRRMTDSGRCCTIEGAFSLWTTYMQAGQQLQATYPGQVMIVRYEDLLTDPTTHLPRILAFCRLPASGALHAEPDRIFAYRHNPALLPLATQFQPTLERHGYPHV